MPPVKVQKTYTARSADLHPGWHLVDASEKILGRMAVEVARLLQGKHRPTYTPNLPTGDFVVVVNAARVKVSGGKMKQMLYRTHSGYPGGLKETTLEEMLQRRPEKVVQEAVWGMLPKNSLGRLMLRRLKVYAGPDHPHQSQLPGAGGS
jgi:large subunit ribosomal protein L13